MNTTPVNKGLECIINTARFAFVLHHLTIEMKAHVSAITDGRKKPVQSEGVSQTNTMYGPNYDVNAELIIGHRISFFLYVTAPLNS